MEQQQQIRQYCQQFNMNAVPKALDELIIEAETERPQEAPETGWPSKVLRSGCL
jgi:hypothetical protein